MSAILAGICIKCNEPFFVNYGHTKWFKDMALRGIVSKQWTAYENLREKRICSECGKDDWDEFIKVLNQGLKEV